MIKFVNGDAYRDIYFVGDIHGQRDKLIKQLTEMGFDFEKDLCVATGDLVDRGSQGYETAMLLNERWFDSVLGNHDHFCVQGYFDSRYENAHKQANNGGAWFYELENSKQVELVNLFSNLPYLIELEKDGKKYGVVHADLPYYDWEVVKKALINNKPVVAPYSDRDRDIKMWLIWARELVYKRGYEIANIDHVFIGHTALTKKLTVGNVSFVDSGSVYNDGDLCIVQVYGRGCHS